MEGLLLDILARVRGGASTPAASTTDAAAANTAPRALAPDELARIIRAHNERRGGPGGPAPFAKKQLLPFYLRVKREEPEHWRSWGIDAATEAALMQTLRMKPGRTASGVATVTVLTKPWPCRGACAFCPNDVRMPKSYLADEPACQRAERSWFDPYLQVATRLATLFEMGHVIDKVELIVLGGTWDDYPRPYQTWFVCQLFRALNDSEEQRRRTADERRAFYRRLGMAETPDEAAAFAAAAQCDVDAGATTYNQAVRALYGSDAAWQAASAMQHADDAELTRAQRKNETACNRCVGLVVETRPDAISAASLARLRALGCTKVQMGIQSLNDEVLASSGRAGSRAQVRHAFVLLRLFGFKTHVHAMVNLPGSTPEADMRDYRLLVSDPAFSPDEVKLYPCALVGSTELSRAGAAEAASGAASEVAPHASAVDGGDTCGATQAPNAASSTAPWRPYTEEELIDVLAADVAATPPYTRISRMIRDISAADIIAGNKKTNLRETVDARLAARGTPVAEMRSREVRGGAVDPAALSLSEMRYPTAASCEVFLQWTTPDNRLAGFLRLSLPDPEAVRACASAEPGALPIAPSEAVIREVHVYGRVAALQGAGQNAQHRGLGRQLVARACDIAREEGYRAVNVISAVGTREYYRRLGFADAGLYQRKQLHSLDAAGPS